MVNRKSTLPTLGDSLRTMHSVVDCQTLLQLVSPHAALKCPSPGSVLASLHKASHLRCGSTQAACSGSGAASSPDAAVDPGLEAFKSCIGERRFLCTQCGKCCTGDGEVWISDAEAATIAAYLGMPLHRFHKQHTHVHSRIEGFRLLRTQGNEAADCTFLRPDNTCAIHTVRPLQCSTYPWWPDLMEAREWEWEKSNICEGFDHPDAPPTDVNEAARQLKLATAQEYRKLLGTKPGKQQRHAAAVVATPVSLMSLLAAEGADAEQEPAAGLLGDASSSSSHSGRGSSRSSCNKK